MGTSPAAVSTAGGKSPIPSGTYDLGVFREAAYAGAFNPAPGAATVNLQTDFGAPADGSDVSSQFQAAQGALPRGGRIVVPPGLYGGAWRLTANQPITVDMVGAVLIPPVGGIAFEVSQLNGSLAAGCEINGLFVDGTGIAGASAYQVTNSDRAKLRNFRFINLANKSIRYVSSNGGWVEQCSAEHGFILAPGVAGTEFAVLAGGTGSFGENVFFDVGTALPPGPTTAIGTSVVSLGGTPANLYRSKFMNHQTWFSGDGTGTGIQLDGDLYGVQAHWTFEQLGAGGAAAKGNALSILNTATFLNGDKADIMMVFTGTFLAANQPGGSGTPSILNPGSKVLTYRQGSHSLRTYSAAAPAVGPQFYLDPNAFPQAAVGFNWAGGGAWLLGGGTGAPDVVGYRDGLGRIKFQQGVANGNAPAAPVTLADVIAIIRGCGLSQ